MRVECTPRQYSVRVYDEGKETNYSSSCQVFRYGDRAELYSIIGKGFYAAMPLIFAEVEKEGCKTLEGYVSKPHARLLRMKGSLWGLTAEITGEGEFDGHNLVWVVVKRK